MKKLLLFLMLITIFSSCEKEMDVAKEIPISLTKEFSKTFIVSDKSGLNEVSVIVSSDNKSSINGVTKNSFTLTPSRDKITLNQSDFENSYEFENGTDAELKEDLENSESIVVEYSLIKAAEGITRHSIKFNESNNKGWLVNTKYYADGYIGAAIQKTNSSGKTKARIGVLWSTSSWWYSWQVKDVLHDYLETVSWFTCGEFYKIAVKRNNRYGSTSVYDWYINSDNFCD